MDVGIVFRVQSLYIGVRSFIAGAGESGISFGHLEEGISIMEVGVVVISWQPAGSGVGDLIGRGTVLHLRSQFTFRSNDD